jgi:integrase
MYITTCIAGGFLSDTKTYIHISFRKALVKIGINEAEITRRSLTIHGWRHFLNTELLNQGLTVMQVQGVTRHKSINMTERYNHLSAEQMTDVCKAQAVIAGTQKPKEDEQPTETKTAQNNQQSLTLVKMPSRKTA